MHLLINDTDFVFNLGENMPDKRPFDVLNGALNNTVVIGLKGGVEFRGVMAAYDVHMNIVLENAEQMVNGEVKRGMGTILLRGDSVIYVSPS
jgi:small nuclear ribonucleoprotein